jgi:DNA repair protein RadC
MRHSMRSAPSLNVRPRVISLAHSAPSFTTGLVADTGSAMVQLSDDEIIDMALRVLAQRVSNSTQLDNPEAARQYLALRFAGLEHEVVTCLYLDNRRRVIACEDLFRGTIDGCSVHAREVVKQALIHNAAAVILAHNHPSGVAEPSQADQIMTSRLKAALDLVNISLVDHLVVGGAIAESMAERGFL